MIIKRHDYSAPRVRSNVTGNVATIVKQREPSWLLEFSYDANEIRYFSRPHQSPSVNKAFSQFAARQGATRTNKSFHVNNLQRKYTRETLARILRPSSETLRRNSTIGDTCVRVLLLFLPLPLLYVRVHCKVPFRKYILSFCSHLLDLRGHAASMP